MCFGIQAGYSIRLYIMTLKDIKSKKTSQSTGFEPVREDPNRFLVYRLNHSATTAARLKCVQVDGCYSSEHVNGISFHHHLKSFSGLCIFIRQHVLPIINHTSKFSFTCAHRFLNFKSFCVNVGNHVMQAFYPNNIRFIIK